MIPNKRRASRQRDRIYELIRSSVKHPTVQWVFDVLKKEMPKISLGNVYRNIRILEKEGMIKCRDFGDGVGHYDAITGYHHHFICEKCGSISDFNVPFDHGITTQARKKSKNRITGHSIQFFGICEKCLKKNKKGGTK